MFRKAVHFLEDWFKRANRKPLVIRGARQVGKTWLVRDFAKNQGIELIEINLERKPEWASLFQSNDPADIIEQIEGTLGVSLDVSKSLLFLDEIQEAPELLAKLRWFAEDMPSLAVVAAGSLLEFALEDHSFSMPVGRINYLHLEPMTFEEFLVGVEENQACDFLGRVSLGSETSEALHQKLMGLIKEFFVVGGMPAAVSEWSLNRDLASVSEVHQNLLATYQDDFSKYTAQPNTKDLRAVLAGVPSMLGDKVIYSKIESPGGSKSIKQAFQLLALARIVTPITLSHGNGIPLAAEANPKFFKPLFLDIGLCSAILGLNLSKLRQVDHIGLINKGGLSEQFVGQILRSNRPFYMPPDVFYWAKTQSQSNAEIDYLYQYQEQVIPIEVKAGKTGSMKSLQQFMLTKQKKLAVRFNAAPMSLVDVELKATTGELTQYPLLSLPLYLSGQLDRLLNEFFDS